MGTGQGHRKSCFVYPHWVLPYGEVLQHPHSTPAGFQLCSPSLPAGCWPQGSRPEPGGSCGTLPKPAVWTPRTAGRRKAPWLRVIDQLGRKETWVLEEGGEASSLHWCPTVSPGPQSWTCCARDAPSPGTTRSWNSGTHTSPGRMHSSWASVREEGGCGQAKGGREGSSSSPWVRVPPLAGLVTLHPSQAHQWGHQSQLPAQPGPK